MAKSGPYPAERVACHLAKLNSYPAEMGGLPLGEIVQRGKSRQDKAGVEPSVGCPVVHVGASAKAESN